MKSHERAAEEMLLEVVDAVEPGAGLAVIRDERRITPRRTEYGNVDVTELAPLQDFAWDVWAEAPTLGMNIGAGPVGHDPFPSYNPEPKSRGIVLDVWVWVALSFVVWWLADLIGAAGRAHGW